MRYAVRYGVRTLVIVLSLVASASATTPTKCCFTNSGYKGTCMVTPEKGETCDKIFDYLNNPNSTGKNYCESTTIRGGWHHASCSAGKK